MLRHFFQISHADDCLGIAQAIVQKLKLMPDFSSYSFLDFRPVEIIPKGGLVAVVSQFPDAQNWPDADDKAVVGVHAKDLIQVRNRLFIVSNIAEVHKRPVKAGDIFDRP